MDIHGIGPKAGSSAANSHKTTKTQGGTKGEAHAELSSATDFFENSGKLGRVRALINDLVQVPDFDLEAVARGKELLESGALDSAEAFEGAAEGFLSGDAY
ncbi:MAG: hypothetical protein V3W41_17190 [Planctomycetota bacterium]